jgi:tRNA A37 threonylcarbamoyladenosine modification protein TsaB
VATDARRKEVYWARYTATGARHSEPAVDHPEVVSFDGPVAGRGATMYPDAFPRPVSPEYPSAADLARLVLGGAAVELPPEPLYLRRPDAVASAARKPVL